jgi:hypothetical protein
LCERNGRERLEVEEGADKRARAVSRSGKEGEIGSGSFQRRRAGLGRGGKEGARVGRLGGNGSMPIGPEGGRGKENKFSFSNLIFQIQFQMFLNLF